MEGGMSLEIDQILVGRFAVFCYLVTESVSREALVVDPGAQVETILERVGERKARIRWIVCTHTHPDHVGGVGRLKAETGASVVLHREEARTLGKMTHRVLVRLIGGRPVGKADRLVEDGELLELGEAEVRVLHTPGHSPGGICLLAEGHLFSGDTLFVGSVGRIDLPGASWEVLSSSLREKVLSLPGETRLWPGHHYGSLTTNSLEAEKRTNPFLREILARS
jgi:glyoxylase-like metal-dependent hydrolase (beta-lactamase superfamily II)